MGMQEKVNKYAEKLNMQKHNSQFAMIVGDCNPDFDFPEPLINYDEEEEKEKEKQQSSENLIEEPQEILKEDAKDAQITEESQQVQQNQEPDHEINETHTDLNESVQRLEAKCVGARSEEALNIDLYESVQRLEAKCAGVREELGNMALSEQYMRTKQAQLRARKRNWK